MQRRVARALRHIITLSRNSATDIVHDFGVPPERLRVIPVGMDPAVFHPMPQPRMPGRIVTVANADIPIKGVSVLLDAVARLRASRDVGARRGDQDNPRRAGGTAGRDAWAWRHRAVRLGPGPHFSLPAIEAMAGATPLVATRTGALPEVVGDDGTTALLVTPGKADELAIAIERLLDDPSRRACMGVVSSEILCASGMAPPSQENPQR
jgi:glycosyltransferase involved in cell wall biosynthesis